MSEIILTGIYPVNDYRSYLRHSDEVERKYGLPDKKKYPMPDRDHVMSAIKFFNYVSPADEKELAKSIIARIKEYGITDINVGENNRFGKYYKPDYLEHHGIMGQKWGIRNGPPYPLGFSDHSSAEKKFLSSNKSDSKPKTTKDDMDHSKSDKTELTTYLAWLGFDIVTLNPYGLAYDIHRAAHAAHAEVKTRKVEKMRAQSRVDKKTGLHVKSREFSEKEDMYMVNPSFKNFDKNTKNNCMLCTTAYDMRRRGYEVSAKKASRGYKEEDALRWYKNSKLSTVQKPTALSFKEAFLGNKNLTEKVTRELVKQGEGARGNLMLSWNVQGGGHSVVYEIKDSKLILRDCQDGRTYNNPAKLINTACGASYIRLDNIDPNMKRIKEAVR